MNNTVTLYTAGYFFLCVLVAAKIQQSERYRQIAYEAKKSGRGTGYFVVQSLVLTILAPFIVALASLNALLNLRHPFIQTYSEETEKWILIDRKRAKVIGASDEKFNVPVVELPTNE